MYKIVDGFNGGEDEMRFDNLEAAEKQLDKEVTNFFKQLGNINSQCCLIIVPADAEWSFDHCANKFAW